MNKVLLVGNLATDPELRMTPNGNAVCSFRVATDDGYGEKKKVEFHNIIVWGKQAEQCNTYLKKGSKVALEGSISTRSYEDKQGNKRYVTEITAREVEFLSGKPKEDDIPF